MRWRWMGGAVAVMVAGVGLGKWIRGGAPRAVLPVPRPVLFGLLAVVVFVVLLVHELGHLAGAVSAGFRVQLLTVGVFSLVREGERLRLRWNWDWGRLGGLAAAVPVAGCDVRGGLRRMIVGGPLASLLLGVLGWVVFAWGSGVVGLVGALVGGFSLVIGVTTAIPGAMGGFVSDGGRYLMLRRGGMEAERWVALAGIVPGARPREWGLEGAREEWVDGSVDGVMLASAMYCYALDWGRTEEAGRWLDRMIGCLEEAAPYMRPGVMVEAAWFAAARRGRAEEGRAWLERVGASGYVAEWSLRRAEAAVLRAEGLVEAAEGKRVEALGLLEKAGGTGLAAFERGLLG